MADDSSTNPAYFYSPNITAAIIFAILFTSLLALHIWQTSRYKSWFMIILLIAGVLETEGYVLRAVSAKAPYPLWAAIVSQTGLIVAPAFLAAQSYMIVGRMMAFIGCEYSYIDHNKITGIFVGSDIISILTQSSGGAMLASAQGDVHKLQLSKNILLAGLALQVITFGIFLFVAVAFDLKSSRAPALKQHDYAMRQLRGLWFAFYVSGILITARSIYRTAEFGEVSFTPGENNPQGYAITHEWPMYAFDGVPILVSMICFAIWHPGRFLPTQKGLRLDGTYEAQKGRRKYFCFGSRKPSAGRSVDGQGRHELESLDPQP